MLLTAVTTPIQICDGKSLMNHHNKKVSIWAILFNKSVFALWKALLRKSFVKGLYPNLWQCVVDFCGSLPMSWFYVTSARFPFTWSWGNKTKVKEFRESYGFKQIQKLLHCFTQYQKDYPGKIVIILLLLLLYLSGTSRYRLFRDP